MKESVGSFSGWVGAARVDPEATVRRMTSSLCFFLLLRSALVPLRVLVDVESAL